MTCIWSKLTISPHKSRWTNHCFDNCNHSEQVIQLEVSTQLKIISQMGSFPQVGVKIKNIWNHHLVLVLHGSLVALKSPFFNPLFTTRPSDSRLGIFLLSLKWQWSQSGFWGHWTWSFSTRKREDPHAAVIGVMGMKVYETFDVRYSIGTCETLSD